MNNLVCNTEECESIIACDEDVVKVTCSNCCVTIGVTIND